MVIPESLKRLAGTHGRLTSTKTCLMLTRGVRSDARTTITTTTIISEGADPLRPARGHPTEGRPSRASPEYIWLIPVSGSPNPRFPPYVVRTLHVHGAPGYGEDTDMEVKTKPWACRSNVWKALLGDVGGLNGPQVDRFRSLWAALVAWAANRRSKRPSGIERRRAPNVTPSMVWRTCVRESI